MSNIYKIKQQLINCIYESKMIKNQLTFIEHCKMLRWAKNLTDNEVLQIKENSDEIKKLKTKQILKTGIATAAVVIPGGIAIGSSINYLIDSYNSKCEISCKGKPNIDLCYKICKYNAIKQVTKMLESEYKKCDQTKNMLKCRKKIRSLLSDQRKKLIKAKYSLDNAKRLAAKRSR